MRLRKPQPQSEKIGLGSCLGRHGAHRCAVDGCCFAQHLQVYCTSTRQQYWWKHILHRHLLGHVELHETDIARTILERSTEDASLELAVKNAACVSNELRKVLKVACFDLSFARTQICRSRMSEHLRLSHLLVVCLLQIEKYLVCLSRSHVEGVGLDLILDHLGVVEEALHCQRVVPVNW